MDRWALCWASITLPRPLPLPIHLRATISAGHGRWAGKWALDNFAPKYAPVRTLQLFLRITFNQIIMETAVVTDALGEQAATSATATNNTTGGDVIATVSNETEAYEECPIDKHGCYCCEDEYKDPTSISPAALITTAATAAEKAAARKISRQRGRHAAVKDTPN
eukprot:scaffold12233_cov78-Skeletonema_dohrnii-CCMP3373.AAC.1